MSDREQSKPSPSSPGSSSASGSSSPDALDSASVRRLAEALHGLRQGLDDEREQRRAETRKADFRQQMTLNAVEKNTAAIRGLANEVKLSREVARSGQQELAGAAGKLKEVTGEFKTMAETDAITDKQLRLRWSTLFRLAPLIAKGVALIASGIAAAWAWAKYHAHNLLD